MDFVMTFGFDKEISLVLGADDVTKAKPDPEPVLLTLKNWDSAHPGHWLSATCLLTS